jgi:hypothetical protein
LLVKYAIAFGLCLAGTLLAQRSDAFCRTTTVRAPPDFDSSEKCFDQGVPLFWRNACVGFSLQKADGKTITAANLGSVFGKAAAAWSSVSCPGGGKPSIELKQLASSTVDTVEYRSDGSNVNLVVMRDAQWPYPAGSESLALTTLAFAADTGEIFDADIEINTAGNTFATSDPVAPDAWDLQTILTHQVGHLLGFAHSAESTSPMFATGTTGSTDGRTLKADDIAGVCEVYAPDGSRKILDDKVTQAAACDPTPRGGLELAPDPPKSGCATSAVPSRSGIAWTGTALAALALLSVARRSRRRS